MFNKQKATLKGSILVHEGKVEVLTLCVEELQQIYKGIKGNRSVSV